MNNPKIRLTAIAGTTMALVIAGTASVAAFGPRDDDREFGPGKSRMGAEFKGRLERGMAERGAMRAGVPDGIRAAIDDLERREVSIQTVDGISTRRIENGVVDAATATGVDFSLGSGEAVTVVIDEDTRVIALSEETIERGRWSRVRLAPTEIEVADIEIGAEILVWSDSEDGSDFVAQRIVVQPADDADADTLAEDEAEATETETEEAGSTDA